MRDAAGEQVGIRVGRGGSRADAGGTVPEQKSCAIQEVIHLPLSLADTGVVVRPILKANAIQNRKHEAETHRRCPQPPPPSPQRPIANIH